MRKHTVVALILGPMVAGCELIGPRMDGRWDVELTEFDRCQAEIDLEQDGDELLGEADVLCRVYFTIYGEPFYYDFEEPRAEVEGRRDGKDFDLTISFWDDTWEYDVEVVLEGTLDGDTIEGDAELDGDDAGEFEGVR